MRLRCLLILSTALVVTLPAMAWAEDTSPAVEDASEADGAIVVTARKREEALNSIPVAATAISGDTLEAKGINSVKDAALLSPSLNINSDGTGRAFVAIRGVGVTLVQSVQPGVGLFIDGIYQPNTAYLNNPLLDVARIEVLRGPQGTLYGKNTLGGAINVITRQPGNDIEVRAQGSYAGSDNAWLVSGSLSVPVVKNTLAVRIAASHRQQDGFLTNTVIGGQANPFNTDSVRATILATPLNNMVLTVKGYYEWVDGVNTPYSRVNSPQYYSRAVQFNALNRVNYRYRGFNTKLEVPVDGINSTLTLISAYDARSGRAPDNDVDFGPLNIARSATFDELRTKTVELRLDSKWSDTISSLFGLFYSRETTAVRDLTTIVPAGLVRTTLGTTKADTYAAFSTLFWRPNDAWEVALGLRYDHENRQAQGAVTFTGTGGMLPDARIKSNQVEPRLTITRHWTPKLITYASAARGYRGGGFNAPTAPVRSYKGDSVWTYELGTKYASVDRNATLSAAVFYIDYTDYIGLNSIAPAAGGGLVTVDLNTGDVESYGLEFEAAVRPVPAWALHGALTLMHARITDAAAYTSVTGRVLSSDRLTFQPDWNATVSTDYTFDLGGSELVLDAGLTFKGKRLAATLNQITPTFLDGYRLANASITWRRGPVGIAVFAKNIFDKDYFESYIEKTTLQLAGLPASDLGITGDRRRFGVNASLRF